MEREREGGERGRGEVRERERETHLNHFESCLFLRMTVLGRGLIFQPDLLACTYNDTITLQKKITEKERGGRGKTDRQTNRQTD